MKPLRRLLFLLAMAASGILSLAADDAPRFNHAAFYVLDLKASADFYREVIGLPVIPEPFHDGNWIEINDAKE